jgi:MoxR-like ATPase
MDDVQAIEEIQKTRDMLYEQISHAVVGQRDVIEQMLIVLLARGHAILVGVPGLAKTLIVRSLARSLDLRFSRIQFTPDLMPSDITGIEVIHEDKASGQRDLRFHKGPIFANLILADEINRTPPKTQAALLEAMQELQVTVGGIRHELETPFVVLATQNPIEQEGTYPLPEALLDRFMFQIHIDYPTESEELDVVLRTTAAEDCVIEPVINRDRLESMCQLIRRMPIAEHVANYGLQMARLSRPVDRQDAINNSKRNTKRFEDFINSYVTWGAGPRAAQYLILAAKALAALKGQACVSMEHIKSVAYPVLRHRIRTNFAAKGDGVSVHQVIDRIIAQLSHEIKPNERSSIGRLFRSPDDRKN